MPLDQAWLDGLRGMLAGNRRRRQVVVDVPVVVPDAFTPQNSDPTASTRDGAAALPVRRGPGRPRKTAAVTPPAVPPLP